MNISFFPDAEKSAHWEDIKALLEPAAALGGIEPKEDVDLIWIAHEAGKVWAAFTVRVIRDAVELRCAGGTRLREWVEEVDSALSAFARDVGKRRLSIHGRKGWRRFGDRLGWACKGRDEQGLWIFEKDLRNGRRK